MIKLHCSKALQSLINLNTNKIEHHNYSELNTWSGHVFNLNRKKCMIFINHKTFFYFTILNIDKNTEINMERFFIDGLILGLKKYKKISLKHESMLKDNFKGINLYNRTENRHITTMITGIITLHKIEKILDEEDKKIIYSDCNDMSIFNELELLFR
jgi:hypothetical protein